MLNVFPASVISSRMTVRDGSAKYRYREISLCQLATASLRDRDRDVASIVPDSRQATSSDIFLILCTFAI